MPDYTVVLDGILLVLSSLLVQPPPVLNRPTTEQLYVVNSGLSRLQNGHQDLYEPGTQGVTALDFLWTCDLAWRSPDRPPVYIRSVIVLPPALPSFLL
jgi:hypothetical protein